MVRKLTVTAFALIATAAVALSVVMFTGSSFAQEATTPDTEAGTSLRDVISEYISEEAVTAAKADAFGMSVEAFEAAKEEAQAVKDQIIDDAIAAALADGEITQDDVDAYEAGDRPDRATRRAVRQYIDRDAMQTAVADAFDMTVEEFDTAKAAAKEAVQALKNDAIDQAVADGAITAEEAETLREGRRGKGRNGRRGGQQQQPTTAPAVDAEL